MSNRTRWLIGATLVLGMLVASAWQGLPLHATAASGAPSFAAGAPRPQPAPRARTRATVRRWQPLALTAGVNAPLVTNLNSDQVSIVLTTTAETTGTVIFGSSPTLPLTQTALDDRDAAGAGAATASTVHRFTVAGLASGSTYYYEPVIGGVAQTTGAGTPFSITTYPAGSAPPGPSTPFSQTVLAPQFDVVTGTVAQADLTTPPSPGSVLIVGYWTNPDSTRSGPVSTITTTPSLTSSFYLLSNELVTADGAHQFTPAQGAFFTTVGFADVAAQLVSGGPITATYQNQTFPDPPFDPIPFYTSMPRLVLSSTLSASASVPLQTGWNLVALPLMPSGGLQAQAVLTTVLSGGGSFAELAAWTGSGWTTALDTGSGLVGTNFTLTIGQGYFVYADHPVTLTVTGSPPVVAPQALGVGWNLIGVPAATGGQMASDLLTSLAAQGLNPLEVALWTGSAWQTLLQGPSGTIGTDFALDTHSGYFVYVQTAGQWSGALAGSAARKATTP